MREVRVRGQRDDACQRAVEHDFRDVVAGRRQLHACAEDGEKQSGDQHPEGLHTVLSLSAGTP